MYCAGHSDVEEEVRLPGHAMCSQAWWVSLDGGAKIKV